ncbi:PaaI family thioesterase [Arachnia propionica]|uniref:PaaI family thioesterase n=1 Tax=Arachnia propionica TaxID=1750 RepID=UPI0021AD5EC2|nr:PaaI family thioesterase [Arachnia propionica]
MTIPTPAAELHERLDLQVLEADAHRVVGVMPVEGNRQPAGLLHGGATAAMVEGLASIGAWCAAQPDRQPVGVDLNVTHLAAVRSGTVTGVATAVRIGTGSAVYTVVVTDEHDHTVALGRMTLRLLPRRDGLSPSSCAR